MRQSCRGMTSNRDQFRSDCHPDFFRRDRTDIEPDRSVDAIKQMSGSPLSLQCLENLNDLSLRADHPDVFGTSLHGPAQDVHIVSMTTRDDYDVGGFSRVELLHRLVEVERVDFARRSEALLRRVRGAIIGHNHIEARTSRSLANIKCHVTCAKNIK